MEMNNWYIIFNGSLGYLESVTENNIWILNNKNEKKKWEKMNYDSIITPNFDDFVRA